MAFVQQLFQGGRRGDDRHVRWMVVQLQAVREEAVAAEARDEDETGRPGFAGGLVHEAICWLAACTGAPSLRGFAWRQQWKTIV